MSPSRAAPWLAWLLAGAAAACSSPPYLPARLTAPPMTPGDVAHHEGFFTGQAGAELYEQSWQAPSPIAVLVIVHGLKDHGSRYATFANGLASDGVSVYAADLRGHAHSDGMRVYIDTFDQYLGDLDTFLAFVHAREPGKPVFLMGHSMGGTITTLYAMLGKQPIAGLILSAAALRANVGFFKSFGTSLAAGLGPRGGVFQLDLNDFSRDPDVVAAGFSDPLIYQGPAPARTAKRLLGAIDQIDQHMEDVATPLLILHGTLDRVTPPEASQELYQRASSEDKTLKLYDGLFHDLLHEPEKDRVIRDITAWIHSHAPTASASGTPR
jgi:alpha-beta hydrolase superfamily lysophospholipase